MDWEIVSFERVGPVRFGMSPEDVAALLGPPDSSRKGAGSLREFRAVDLPIISYDDGAVTEIEAFYDVENVRFRGIDIFGAPGAEVMRRLEHANGGAVTNVGVVVFEEIGISAGRLDEGVRENHSVTAFAKGLWDGGSRGSR